VTDAGTAKCGADGGIGVRRVGSAVCVDTDADTDGDAVGLALIDEPGVAGARLRVLEHAVRPRLMAVVAATATIAARRWGRDHVRNRAMPPSLPTDGERAGDVHRDAGRPASAPA